MLRSMRRVTGFIQLAAVAVPLLCLGLSKPARACTTFLVGSEVGKCYDWDMGQGVVLLNPRGLAKQVLSLTPGERPASWVAKYASVTFNQYGRELPNGGLNEAGLVVEVMWLPESEPAPPDERPTVNELQFIQWLLDQYANVHEVALHAPEVRISQVGGKVHYLACDASRACIALEMLGGELVVTAGEGFSTPVLTNNTYGASVARFRASGGKAAARAKGAGSTARFLRAAAAVGAGEAPWSILSKVRNARSQWEIVYDLDALTVRWRTRASRRQKQLGLKALATGCDAVASMVDIDADAEGDVAGLLRPYTLEANRLLVTKGLATLPLPKGTARRVAAYPDSARCTLSRAQ